MPSPPSPTCDAAPRIALSDIRQVFGSRTVIGEFNLHIERSEFLVILGPSGCGKSTLLRLIAGLITPTSGRIDIDPPDAGIGFVFQDASLLPWRTALQNVLLPLELQGIGGHEAQREALDLLKDVGLQGFHDHYPDSLSGGMKMRVSIARALAGRPSLLLLDEPFAALDEVTRSRLDQHLRDLSRKRAITTLFVTHSISEAVTLAERIIVLRPPEGQIVHEERVNRDTLTSEERITLIERLSSHLETPEAST
jgi:NitT/TauT family transport system ATP-binding protein